MNKLSEKLLKPRWVVDEDGDPGIALGRGPLRIIIGYYKWADNFIIRRASKVGHREAMKRELRVTAGW